MHLSAHLLSDLACLLFACVSPAVNAQVPAAVTLTDGEKKDLPKALRIVRDITGSDTEDVNSFRQEYLKELFRKVAKDANVNPDLSTMLVRPGGDLRAAALSVPNLIVRVPGDRPDEIIVVGAHLDRVDVGTGIIDDWSGAVVLTGLYKRLLQKKPSHTVWLVGFAYEEDGLWGSQTLVNDLEARGTLSRVKAMVNLECLGVTGVYVWNNGSAMAMSNLAKQVNDETTKVTVDFKIRDLFGVGADSVPFSQKHIPAITFDSLGPNDMAKIHSTADALSSIIKSHAEDEVEGYNAYLEGYRFILDYVGRLDGATPADPALPRSFAPGSLPLVSFHPVRANVGGRVGAAGFTGRAAPDAATVRAAIDRANRAWEKAVADWSQSFAPDGRGEPRDVNKAREAADAIAALYAADAVVLPPDGEVIHGRGSIERSFEGLARYAASVSLRTDPDGIDVSPENARGEVAGASIAYERGSYTSVSRKGEKVQGKSFVVWRVVPDSSAPGGVRAYFLNDMWYPTSR